MKESLVLIIPDFRGSCLDWKEGISGRLPVELSSTMV